MQGFGTIVTQGKGVRALEAYFGLFNYPLPPELPKRAKDWGNGATYEAPHGFLTVGTGGSWQVTFALNSVAADIDRIPGLSVSAM